MDIPLQRECILFLFIDAWTQFAGAFDFKKYKRIKLPDGSYIARSSTGGVIIPQESKGSNHYTFCKKDGRINFHKTSDDKQKAHEQILDVSETDQKNIEEKLRQEVSKMDMKIDIKNRRFKDCFIVAKLASFQPAFETLFQIDRGEVKPRKDVGNADICEVIEKHTKTARLEDIDTIEFQKAWLCADNGKVVGRLRKTNGTYYLCTNEQATDLLKNSGIQTIVDTVGRRVKG